MKELRKWEKNAIEFFENLGILKLTDEEKKEIEK
jgi:hypothetical protein